MMLAAQAMHHSLGPLLRVKTYDPVAVFLLYTFCVL